MPLPLLAAAATQAATLFSYNRQNFMYNRGQQVTRAFTGLNYKLQQFALYRQDIRDLVGLTTDKMSNYHVVACLELGMCATLLGPARLPADVPEWVLWHQLVCLCAAFAYLVASMWFATRAAVAADSFNVRLQTQWIRLPVPDDELLDSALTRAEAFETEGLNDMLRVPLLTGVFRRVFDTGSGRAKEDTPAADEGSEVETQPSGTGLGMSSVTALQMYQQLQRNWSCYDAYARVTMSVGTYWLAISLAYYQIGWTMCHQGHGLPAVVVALMFCGVIILLIYVDIFLSTFGLVCISLLVCSGPIFAAVGAGTMPPGVDDTHWCSIVVGFVHVALSAWLWHQGSIVPGKADLPTRFKGVVYLDIFGPIVRQIRGYLDQTGLGQHAIACPEDEQGEDDMLSSAPMCKTKSGISSATTVGNKPLFQSTPGNAERAAEAIGINMVSGLMAEPTPSSVRREVQKTRRVLLDWKDGVVGQHLGCIQQQELQQMCEDMDTLLQGLPEPKYASKSPVGFANVAGSQTRHREKTMEYCDIGPASFGCASGSWRRPRTAQRQQEAPTILRSLSAGSIGPCPDVWTKVETEGNPNASYWVGGSIAAAKGADGRAPPKDAIAVDFKDVQALCARLVVRAEQLGVYTKREEGKPQATGLRSRQRRPTLEPSAFEGKDSEVKATEEGTGRRHRRGHQPVVAFRVLCAALLVIWLVGILVHALRLQQVQLLISGSHGANPGGSDRRLSSTPQAFKWPEPFFRAHSLFCIEDTNATSSSISGPDGSHAQNLRPVASNGYLVYRLSTSPADAPLQLHCPVEEHDALVFAECSGGVDTNSGTDSGEGDATCKAVVAASGQLWECSSAGMQVVPLAAVVGQSDKRGRLELWAARAADSEVLFAAPRSGKVLQLRRQGGELRPVAELDLPRGLPQPHEWLSLTIARASWHEEAGEEEVLLASASPGPMIVSWSLRTGRLLGAWPQRANPSGLLGSSAPTRWCPTSQGSLYSAADLQDNLVGGLEFTRMPVMVPRI